MTDTRGYKSQIQGYTMVQTNTMNRMKHCRLLMLVKDEMDIEILGNIMEQDLATIWIRIRRQGKKSLIIGAIYREQHQLLQSIKPSQGENERLQIQRWSRITDQWVKAARLGETYVIGDMNLDHLRWYNPPRGHQEMVEAVKSKIETIGFCQIGSGHTRSWRGQPDTRIDHIWTDNPGGVISTRNVIRGASDHHVICANIRLKGTEHSSQVIMRRDRSKFTVQKYREKLMAVEWDNLYKILDVNEACQWLESRLQEVLNSVCPMGTIQPNFKMKSWITKETAVKFKTRDRCLEIAKESGLQSDWDNYRFTRNNCTRQMRQDKRDHFKKLYSKIEENRDVKGLFKTTREQLGWSGNGPPQSLLVGGG